MLVDRVTEYVAAVSMSGERTDMPTMSWSRVRGLEDDRSEMILTGSSIMFYRTVVYRTVLMQAIHRIITTLPKELQEYQMSEKSLETITPL